MNKKTLTAFALLLVCLLVVSYAYLNVQSKLVELEGDMGVDFTCGSIHTTFKFYKNGVQVGYQYHAGSVTKLGLNYTLGKLTGNSTAYNGTTYLYNLTYVSIGNQGTLDTDSTVLPGEWNRTTTTMHDCVYNSFNLTAVFHPDAGPYTADCIGVNWLTGIGQDGCLWGYDTFTEVTGIDDTFTITVEIKVSAS